MIVKSPVLPKRIRKIPKSFSWIDHRLVRDEHIDMCSHAAAALYLFLVCVGDDKGLSYYGDKSIMSKLSMDQKTLQTARSELVQKGLLGWQKPIYQVLCLKLVHKSRRGGSATSSGVATEVSND